ncbi:MAG: DUF983 domain-containing protein [Flavobacteriales bacterium]
MPPKKTRLGALLNNRCPKCYEGRLFNSHAYDLKRVSEMPAKCPVCGEDFAREPGFYFGAAYVSYALTVALWIALWRRDCAVDCAVEEGIALWDCVVESQGRVMEKEGGAVGV